jgi:hypothetical protein
MTRQSTIWQHFKHFGNVNGYKQLRVECLYCKIQNINVLVQYLDVKTICALAQMPRFKPKEIILEKISMIQILLYKRMTT